MGVRALSQTSATPPLGGVWQVWVSVKDVDGNFVDSVPVVTVTLPNGTTATPTVDTVAVGVYRTSYVTAAAGRYTARAVAASYGAADFVAYVQAATTAAGMPALADVQAYLGTTSFTDPELQGALDAEAAAQRAVCRVGAVYPADLREALLRRVARNLALRGVPMAVLRGDAEGGDTILPGRDPEVKRLEAPHRKMTVA